MCDNDHPDIGLCIKCFLRLCYEHRYNISTLKCPMCKAKLSLPKPKSY